MPTPAPTVFAFVFVDLTTSATPDNLRPSPSFLEELSVALEEQAEGPFAWAHGRRSTGFRLATGPTDRTPGEIAVNFRDTIPEAPGALAYHQVTNGIPDIEIGCDLFASLSEGADSISAGASHEMLETLGDAGANGYKLRADGQTADAEEVCDFVEATCYSASNGLAVSNFVLPSFFVPDAAGPWDYLGVMTSQTDVSNGYGIVAEVGQQQQIGGEAAREVQDIAKHNAPMLREAYGDKVPGGLTTAEQAAYREGLELAATTSPAPATSAPRAVVGYAMPANVRKRKQLPTSRTSRRGAVLE